MKFNEYFRSICESQDHEGQVYAVYIVETSERITGSLLDLNDPQAFIDLQWWDTMKSSCVAGTFLQQLDKYCKYLQHYNFTTFDDLDASNEYVVEQAIMNATKYKNIPGTWYFYSSPHDCVFAFETSLVEVNKKKFKTSMQNVQRLDTGEL
jgi:hypothetical protein